MTTNAASIDATFDAFVGTLFADDAMPFLSVVEECHDPKEHFKRTGKVAVLAEDESAPCPVFSNWGTYYEFKAWALYRELTAAGRAFQAMVSDVLDRVTWSPEVSTWITIIDGLLNVSKEYRHEFGHDPVNQTKLVKSYMKHGRATVMRADVY